MDRTAAMGRSTRTRRRQRALLYIDNFVLMKFFEPAAFQAEVRSIQFMTTLPRVSIACLDLCARLPLVRASASTTRNANYNASTLAGALPRAYPCCSLRL